VESLQSFVINKKWHGDDITPNLNVLVGGGMFFHNIYDQTGYGNSSDTTLLANASLYPARNGAAAFFYAKNCFDSLPKVLRAAGYTTAAMHANVKHFWNSEVFEKSLGFDNNIIKMTSFLFDKIG
jgi:phosphoglycerol transferase MdoB-like AlkP superfamily enzyme